MVLKTVAEGSTMGRRADHSREQLYHMALVAAGETAAAEGLRGLTARRIAAKIGYSAATLYNLFDDLDDLIVHLNGRTLDALHDALSPAAPGADPAAALRRMVKDYVAFAAAHANLWNLVFEHRLPDDRPLPAWHHGKIARLCALFERPLAPLLGPGREKEIARSARILWASLRGICARGTAQGLDADESVELMADTLVTLYLGGLDTRKPKPAAGKPATGKPAPGKPAPVRRQAVAKPAAAKPAAGKPAAGKPATGKPPPGKPAPVRRQAVAKPAAAKPAAGKPATGKPATGKPATGKPPAGKPTRARPKAVAKPAAAKPAAGKPATGKPAPGKPAPVRRQAVAKPAAGKPAAGKPAPRPAAKPAAKPPGEPPPRPPRTASRPEPEAVPANVSEADQLAADIEGIWNTYESEISEDETLKEWRKRNRR